MCHFICRHNAKKVLLRLLYYSYYLYFSDLRIVQVMFIMATVSCTLVILSLVHFLMALSANYAHIRGHDKFTDLQVVF